MTALDPGDGEAEVRLTRTEAAEYLSGVGIRLKASTLARLWSTGGDGPPCRHIRSKPYYPLDLLQEWARAQISEVRSAAPAAARPRRRARP